MLPDFPLAMMAARQQLAVRDARDAERTRLPETWRDLRTQMEDQPVSRLGALLPEVEKMAASIARLYGKKDADAAQALGLSSAQDLRNALTHMRDLGRLGQASEWLRTIHIGDTAKEDEALRLLNLAGHPVTVRQIWPESVRPRHRKPPWRGAGPSARLAAAALVRFDLPPCGTMTRDDRPVFSLLPIYRQLDAHIASGIDRKQALLKGVSRPAEGPAAESQPQPTA